jgi:hypothetical protein
MAELNIDALVTEFGARYVDNGQTANDIKKQLFAKPDILADFNSKPHNETYYQGVDVAVGEVLQGFIKNFVSKGDPTFGVWKQKMGEFKIDKSLSPTDYWNSWIGFLTEVGAADKTQAPIIQWMITNILLPKAEEDHFLEVFYWGWQFTGRAASESVNGTTFERVIPTGDVALKANTAMDGIRIQLAKMVADSKCNLVTVGAWEPDPEDFVAQFETDFIKSIPRKLLTKVDKFYLSPDLASRYRDGIRIAYNKNYAQQSDLETIKDCRARIVETDSMIGSDQVWGTVPENKVNPRRGNQTGRFDVQKAGRSVNFMNEYSWLYTFDHPALVVTSEHQTTIDSTETDPGGRYDSGLDGGLSS